MFNALFRYTRRVPLGACVCQTRASASWNRGKSGHFRAMHWPEAPGFGAFWRRARVRAKGGVSAQVSVWSPMGMILYDTAISATPLHLTKTDDDPGCCGENAIPLCGKREVRT